MDCEEREKHAVRLWRGRPAGVLLTAAGEPVEVLYPGRPAGAGGPDFQGAVLRLGGREVTGDVEVHLWASQWWAHGHHTDPGYNGVVLHAALWADAPTARLHSGQEVPVLPLSPYAGGPPAGQRCRPACGGAGRRLERWGEERFAGQAAELARRLKAEDHGQVLYSSVAEALGYSANREGFRELARRLPLAQALPCPGEGVEGVCARLSSAARGIPWRYEGVRPANHPSRRLLALGHLLHRFGPPPAGWVVGMAALVRRARAPGGVGAGLVVPGRPALLGAGRAAQIAVDVVLPFFYSAGSGTGDPRLAARCLSLYRRHPPLETNGLIRHMVELLGLEAGVLSSACRQQGLIHLHHTFCRQGGCARCPLGLSPV